MIWLCGVDAPRVSLWSKQVHSELLGGTLVWFLRFREMAACTCGTSNSDTCLIQHVCLISDTRCCRSRSMRWAAKITFAIVWTEEVPDGVWTPRELNRMLAVCAKASLWVVRHIQWTDSWVWKVNPPEVFTHLCNNWPRNSAVAKQDKCESMHLQWKNQDR